jgi:hypothetical protein
LKSDETGRRLTPSPGFYFASSLSGSLCVRVRRSETHRIKNSAFGVFMQALIQPLRAAFKRKEKIHREINRK